MSKKNNNNIIIGAVAGVIAVVGIVVGVVLARGNGGDGGSDSGKDNSGTSQDGGEQMDFSHVDATVMFGDYDEMFKYSKSIQNGEMTGKSIKIEGIVSHPMSMYSITQKDAEKGSIGTVFEIVGASNEDYPQDGDRIVITGKVVEKSALNFIIRTEPRYVEIIERAEK